MTDPVVRILRVGGMSGAERPAEEAASVEIAAAALRRGAVVIFPTETFYGLGADPRSTEGVRSVFRLKRRPRDQPLPWIAADRSQVEEVCRLPAEAGALADRYWPGPLTLVLPLVADSAGTAAVRVSSHPAARALAAALGHPVVSTSANPSGQPPFTSAAGASSALAECAGGMVGLLALDGGPTPGGAPSVILDATSGDLRPLRGSLEDLEPG